MTGLASSWPLAAWFQAWSTGPGRRMPVPAFKDSEVPEFVELELEPA